MVQKILNIDELQLIDDVNPYGLESELRIKSPRNKFDTNPRFTHWDYSNFNSPMSLLDFCKRGSETEFLLNIIEFYLDKNYIITNQFNFYPENHRYSEVRQYRWKLNDKTLKALSNIN